MQSCPSFPKNSSEGVALPFEHLRLRLSLYPAMAEPQIYKSKSQNVLIPTNESIWQHILSKNLEDTPADKVLVEEYGRKDMSLTYGSAPRIAALGAAGLRDVLGLKTGDKILVIGANTMEFVLIEFAAYWAGYTAA